MGDVCGHCGASGPKSAFRGVCPECNNTGRRDPAYDQYLEKKYDVGIKSTVELVYKKVNDLEYLVYQLRCDVRRLEERK